MNRALAAALTSAALLWSVAVVAAPAALQSKKWTTAATLVYAGASRICHQRVERSFRLGGVPLPVCGRCAGLYLSAAAGALAVWMVRQRRPRLAPRNVIIAAALPTVISWGLEHLFGVPFSNMTRAVAALPLGASAGWLLVGMLRYDSRLDGEQVLYS